MLGRLTSQLTRSGVPGYSSSSPLPFPIFPHLAGLIPLIGPVIGHLLEPPLPFCDAWQVICMLLLQPDVHLSMLVEVVVLLLPMTCMSKKLTWMYILALRRFAGYITSMSTILTWVYEKVLIHGCHYL